MNPVRALLAKTWPGEACPPIAHPFGREEAAERIRRKIIPFLSGFAREGLKGSVRNGRIVLYWRRPALGSPWPAVFRGTVVSAPGGCRIEGRISKLRATPVVSAFGLGCAAVFAGPRSLTMTFSVAALAAVALGVAVLTLAQHVSSAERQKLLAELRNL